MGGMGWTPAGDQAYAGLAHAWSVAGPLVAAALLAGFVGLALVRRRRYRVDCAFGEEDRRAVHEAIASAERRTVGEILPVVFERSDAHHAADWLAAASFLVVGSTLLAGWLPWSHLGLWLPLELALGASGFALARALPGFKRLFVSEARASEVAQARAFLEFYANRLHETAAATGVLLFVSLLEHRVVVLADSGIDAKVDAGMWTAVDEAVLEGIRRGSLRDGLTAGVTLVGERLGRHFPWREGDRNEIPNRLIVRRAGDR
jgi:putative membrane protein